MIALPKAKLLGVACRPEPSLVMSAENASNSAPAPPQCPSCAQPMRLIRRTQRPGGLPDLCTFECRVCGVSHFRCPESHPSNMVPIT
jgi:hypothetical protein